MALLSILHLTLEFKNKMKKYTILLCVAIATTCCFAIFEITINKYESYEHLCNTIILPCFAFLAIILLIISVVVAVSKNLALQNKVYYFLGVILYLILHLGILVLDIAK